MLTQDDINALNNLEPQQTATLSDGRTVQCINDHDQTCWDCCFRDESCYDIDCFDTDSKADVSYRLVEPNPEKED